MSDDSIAILTILRNIERQNDEILQHLRRGGGKVTPGKPSLGTGERRTRITAEGKREVWAGDGVGWIPDMLPPLP